MGGHKEYILDRVSMEPMSGCWLWLKHVDQKGYGTAWDGEKLTKAHRLSYRAFRGPIPADLQIDHLCRNRCCANPDHLEIVTNRENQLRSPISVTAAHSRKILCPNGHPLIEGNLHLPTLRKGRRRCLTCRREQHQDYKRRARASKKANLLEREGLSADTLA